MLPALTPPDTIPTAPDSGVRATSPERVEELRLVALAQAGDQRAAAALLRMHAGLLHITCRPYFGNAHDDADVLQAGRIGFMRGVAKFDPTRGVRLWTYCRDWVRLEARDALIESFPIILPRYLHIQVSVSERTGDPSDLARKLRKLLRMAPMDGPVSDYLEYGPVTLGETIPSATPLPDASAAERLDSDAVRELVDGALSRIAPRDSAIVRRRLLGGETLDAIGKSLGLTRERVRQIVAERMDRVRRHIVDHTTQDERDALGIAYHATGNVNATG